MQKIKRKPKGASATLTVLRAILEGGSPTDGELVRLSHLDVRSVYRHLALLRASGIEIESGGADAPGYRVVGGWIR